MPTLQEAQASLSCAHTLQAAERHLDLVYKPLSHRTVLGAPLLSSLTPKGPDLMLWAL